MDCEMWKKLWDGYKELVILAITLLFGFIGWLLRGPIVSIFKSIYKSACPATLEIVEAHLWDGMAVGVWGESMAISHDALSLTISYWPTQRVNRIDSFYLDLPVNKIQAYRKIDFPRDSLVQRTDPNRVSVYLGTRDPTVVDYLKTGRAKLVIRAGWRQKYPVRIRVKGVI
jgi:hypothetical protein